MEEEFQPPTSPLRHASPRPASKEETRECETAATAPEGKGLQKKDSESTSENSDWGQADKSPPRCVAHVPRPPVIQGPTQLPSTSAFGLMPSFQPKQRALSPPQEEEAAGCTGLRTDSKMPVCSGSKGAGLRKMTTLRQQCVRVLRVNINMLFRVGGVRYSVLEPILESCTPDQLHRLEKYNPALVGETDQLWEMHRHRDFKKERPEEHESWREMHTGLREAQEQRLRALTLKIRSASEPKGQQAEMIFLNSFERGAAAAQGNVKIMPPHTPQGAMLPLTVPVATAFPHPGKASLPLHKHPQGTLGTGGQQQQEACEADCPMAIKDIKNRLSPR